MLCTHAIEHVCPFVLRSLTFDPTVNNITTSICGDLDLRWKTPQVLVVIWTCGEKHHKFYHMWWKTPHVLLSVASPSVKTITLGTALHSNGRSNCRANISALLLSRGLLPPLCMEKSIGGRGRRATFAGGSPVYVRNITSLLTPHARPPAKWRNYITTRKTASGFTGRIQPQQTNCFQLSISPVYP